ncbi:hypothetical protein ACFCT7_00515 [Fulvivirgaceae bacterium LMO-SS25]
MATCEEGNGCTFQVSDTDASDYDVVYGTQEGYHESLPENALVVDAKIKGKWEHYIEIEMTRSQLDKFFGGDGFTMIYPFNPNFQPLNGEWQVKVGTVTGDICYGQESNIFKSVLQSMDQSGNVNFPNPFHARFLMNNLNVKWQQVRPDVYKAYLGNAFINLKFDVQIINEKKIEGVFTASINVPTKEPCVNKIPITYTCIKAEEWKDPWEDFETANPDDDLLPVTPKGNTDDLLPVNPKNDDLLPVEPGKEPKSNVPRIDDKANIPRLEDKPKPTIPRIKDKPKTNIPKLEN